MDTKLEAARSAEAPAARSLLKNRQVFAIKVIVQVVNYKKRTFSSRKTNGFVTLKLNNHLFATTCKDSEPPNAPGARFKHLFHHKSIKPMVLCFEVILKHFSLHIQLRYTLTQYTYTTHLHYKLTLYTIHLQVH